MARGGKDEQRYRPCHREASGNCGGFCRCHSRNSPPSSASRFQQLQKYEKGRNRIGAGRLFEIAEILEIPLTFFFEDAVGDNPISGDADVARAGMKILRSFSKIKDPATRKSIADLVEQLAERSDVSRSGR